MRFIHRIGFSATAQQQRQLEALGVQIRVPRNTTMPGDKDTFVAFDVDEDHPNWSRVRPLFERWDVSDFLRTEFSKAEIEASAWLELLANSHTGYPQPKELEFGYVPVTYDVSGGCVDCGVGWKQKAPFQMKNEPKWGKNSILQMNWVFDEYFVRPEVWSSVFKAHGVSCRPVTNRKGVELKTVVQLVVEEEVSIGTDNLALERCRACKRVKYLPVTRGALPALKKRPCAQMVKTREYFGSGGRAFKTVLVSQKLWRAMVAAGVKGASVQPVQE